jgi:hypothetical protein
MANNFGQIYRPRHPPARWALWAAWADAMRICIAYVAIISGTTLLFIGMEDSTADGDPFSYGLWQKLNFLVWSMPSLVAAIYLFIGKNLRILSWAFTGFCCYWSLSVYRLYAKGDFKFIYWHQGDVFCTACGSRYFSLSIASCLFGLCAFAAVLARRRRGAQINSVRLSLGVVALVLLLFSMFAVALSN